MANTIINEDICKGCGLCVNACPIKLIDISKEKINASGYNPAQINDVDRCTGCCACAIMCPDIAIKIER